MGRADEYRVQTQAAVDADLLHTVGSQIAEPMPPLAPVTNATRVIPPSHPPSRNAAFGRGTPWLAVSPRATVPAEADA